MSVASSPAKRPARSVRSTKRPLAQHTAIRRVRPSKKSYARADVRIDMTRREAFLSLPLEEREQRIQSFIDAFAPAFADYSSNDFRADQTREAEREG